MDENVMTIRASVRDDFSVWMSVECNGVRSEIGVYGPYDTRKRADAAAREAVAFAARQIQRRKHDMMAEIIEA